MYPDLISVGIIKISSYGFILAICLLVCLIISLRLGRQENFSKTQILDMGLLILSCGIITSRLSYVLFYHSLYFPETSDILKIWDGGMLFSGGLVGGLVGVWVYCRAKKINFWTISDVWAPGVVAAQALEKLGCFMAGSCYGSPSSEPWAVVFTHPSSSAPLNVPLHPTQLYAMVAYGIIFAVLIILRKRKKFQGQVFLWFLVLFTNAQLLVDRFRGDAIPILPDTRMTASQLLATIILILGATILVFKTPKGRKTTNQVSSS